jgi:hypothetical protein
MTEFETVRLIIIFSAVFLGVLIFSVLAFWRYVVWKREKQAKENAGSLYNFEERTNGNGKHLGGSRGKF